MQPHRNINYLFLGSEESSMTTLFEDVKSPFFHFAALMRLNRIPYQDFHDFLVERLTVVRKAQAEEDARLILELTKRHPFYTQQLAAVFWDLCMRTENQASISDAADVILKSLSTSYTVLWSRMNRTNRRILEVLSRNARLQDIKEFPSSTIYTAVGRLKKEGFILQDDGFVLEDPFFSLWIQRTGLVSSHARQESADGIA